MYKETSTQRLLWYAGQSALGFIACFLFGLVTCTVVGAYYPQTLAALHLDWLAVPLGGIYTDCSLPENRNEQFCRPRTDRTYDLRHAGIREKEKSPQFTLYSLPK